MFDRYVDAFMDGHFPITINSKELEDGKWEASYTSPSGQIVTAIDSSLNEAHRQCAEKVKEGVLKREIHLGR